MSVAETKVGTALNPVELKSNANCLTNFYAVIGR